jgi:hypothetical protein
MTQTKNNMFKIFKAKREYIPNQHLGETKKLEIMEDDYTIAERRKKDLDFLKGESREDTFRDSDGYEMPISQLNGQTETLLRQAREGIKQEIANNKKLVEESSEENDETVESIKNKLRKEKNITWLNSKSLSKFYSGHGRTPEGERVGTKLGLYKDYNPKLNEGAPGNRKEAVRQSKRLAEKSKGEQPFEEPSFEDFIGLPDLDNDNEDNKN